MTENPPPPREAAFFTTIREWGLFRETRGLGGVASGLGARVGMAPAPARLITIVAAVLLPGLVFLAYAAGWGLLPDRNGRIIIQDFGRGVTNVGALLGIAVMAIIGFVTLDSGGVFTWWAGGDNFLWMHGAGPFEVIAALFAFLVPLALLGGLAFLVVYLVRRSRRPNPTDPGTAWNSADAGTSPASASPAAAAAADGHEERATETQEEDTPAQDDASGESDAATAADRGAPAPQPTAPSGPSVAAAATASAGSHHAPRKPQPWEPAVTPQELGGGGSAYAWNAATGDPAPVPPAAPRPAAPTPPTYVRPKPPRVPGPGKGAWLALLGVLLISAAVVVIVGRSDELAVSPVVAFFAVATVGLGAILVVVALAGRRLGFLGFVSVLALLASLPLIANGDEIRDAYIDHGAWWNGGAMVFGETIDGTLTEPTPGPNLPEQISVAEAFGDDYSSVYVEGTCYDASAADPESDWGPWIGYELDPVPNAVTRYDTIDGDTTATLRAYATEVTVPADTSLAVTGVSSQFMSWPDRQVYCEIWSDINDGPVVELTNPDTPVLTLSAYDGGTIILNEEVTP